MSDGGAEGSLKGMFQSLVPASVTLLRGRVTQASPLKIQIVGDEKMELHENIICLPRGLTDYTAKCDITLGGGSVSGQTESGGAHSHGAGDHSGHSAGTGSHAHSGDGAHVHRLEAFSILGASLKVYNSLQTGDFVYVLSFNYGKKYYILDYGYIKELEEHE